jgi:hypothetical protein
MGAGAPHATGAVESATNGKIVAAPTTLFVSFSDGFPRRKRRS